MTDAEHAVHEAAANIPADVCARFENAAPLNDAERKTIIDIAEKSVRAWATTIGPWSRDWARCFAKASRQP
jgi:hypothetical protein